MTRFVNDAGTLRLSEVRFFTGSPRDLLDRVGELARRGSVALVVTANVDHTVKYLRGDQGRSVLEAADLVTLDGAPLVAVARMIGIRRAHRNTGADLLERASAASAARDWRIAIVGGNDEVGRLAAQVLTRRHAGADIHHVSLPILESPHDQQGRPAVDELARLRPDIVFVCLGFPKQEEWVRAWEHKLPAAAYVGAGAAADFAAGTRIRAPRLAQALGAEWLWRIAQEPRRLARRYLVDSVPFVGLAIRSIASRGSTERRRP